jgi:hypothetical protein
VGLVGLRAIVTVGSTVVEDASEVLDFVAGTGGSAVVRDASEVTDPSASTCSKEDSGVSNGEPSLSLSVEHYGVRGSDDVCLRKRNWA